MSSLIDTSALSFLWLIVAQMWCHHHLPSVPSWCLVFSTHHSAVCNSVMVSWAMCLLCCYLPHRRKHPWLMPCFGLWGKGTWLSFSCCSTAGAWTQTAETVYAGCVTLAALTVTPQINFHAVGRIETDIHSLCICFFQSGTTALMVASYSGHYECVRELIMQGADINYQREVWLEKWLAADYIGTVSSSGIQTRESEHQTNNNKKKTLESSVHKLSQPHIFGLWFFAFKRPLFVIDRHIHPLPHVAMILGVGSLS